MPAGAGHEEGGLEVCQVMVLPRMAAHPHRASPEGQAETKSLEPPPQSPQRTPTTCLMVCAYGPFNPHNDRSLCTIVLSFTDEDWMLRQVK